MRRTLDAPDQSAMEIWRQTVDNTPDADELIPYQLICCKRKEGIVLMWNQKCVLESGTYYKNVEIRKKSNLSVFFTEIKCYCGMYIPLSDDKHQIVRDSSKNCTSQCRRNSNPVAMLTHAAVVFRMQPFNFHFN